MIERKELITHEVDLLEEFINICMTNNNTKNTRTNIAIVFYALKEYIEGRYCSYINVTGLNKSIIFKFNKQHIVLADSYKHSQFPTMSITNMNVEEIELGTRVDYCSAFLAAITNLYDSCEEIEKENYHNFEYISKQNKKDQIKDPAAIHKKHLDWAFIRDLDYSSLYPTSFGERSLEDIDKNITNRNRKKKVKKVTVVLSTIVSVVGLGLCVYKKLKK